MYFLWAFQIIYLCCQFSSVDSVEQNLFFFLSWSIFIRNCWAYSAKVFNRTNKYKINTRSSSLKLASTLEQLKLTRHLNTWKRKLKDNDLRNFCNLWFWMVFCLSVCLFFLFLFLTSSYFIFDYSSPISSRL